MSSSEKLYIGGIGIPQYWFGDTHDMLGDPSLIYVFSLLPLS